MKKKVNENKSVNNKITKYLLSEILFSVEKNTAGQSINAISLSFLLIVSQPKSKINIKNNKNFFTIIVLVFTYHK